MKENQKICNCKAMKITYCTQNVKRNGGERNVHFKFIDQETMVKRMKEKTQKRRAKDKTMYPLRQTLNSYIEASKCRTLDKFTEEVRT